MSQSYLVAAGRTPIGKLCGALSTMSAPQLAAPVIRAVVERSGISADAVEQVLLGEVLTAGVGQAPARQAALAGGLPNTIAALTVNKVCGSGLMATMLADQVIRAGDARAIIAGGMESMSRAPHLLIDLRTGRRYGDDTLVDSMARDGLYCSIEQWPMGAAADYIASKFGVSRAAQDEFALQSHCRAIEAQEAGRFRDEIVGVPVKGGVVLADEGPRRDASLAAIAALKPAFDASGTVTAGNASQISDGAACVMLVDEAFAREIDSPIKARIVTSAVHGVAPKDLFIAPVGAIQKALAKARVSLQDIDLVELNEAFAAQCLACLGELKLPHEKVNVHGGAIALGHPIGASGARVLVTLLHALRAANKTLGLASLCLGGGEAVAMIVERV